MSLADQMRHLAERAKDASRKLTGLSAEKKNRVLFTLGQKLLDDRDRLVEANAKDLDAAAAKGVSGAMLDRLRISDKTLDSMVTGLREVAALPDPVGTVSNMRVRPNGMRVGKMRIPLGVIGIIYESRPNVTVDAAALCLKAGNATILRGGSEAIHSNAELARMIAEALRAEQAPEAAVQLVETTDRNAMTELLKLEELIDLVIPRGGEGLIRFVAEHSRIPVIKHYKGVCHTYVDVDADFNKAIALTINGKTQRTGVCNATETLLVHEGFAHGFIPEIGKQLVDKGVELRVCTRTAELLGKIPHQAATEEDWGTEYLDLILAVRVVRNFDEAVAHIQRHGSDHTETIVTENYSTAQRFLAEVNSSCVFVNASTRFADGQQLGLGAEIGISTTKIHAFGPMGVEELTTEKFIVYGSGQIRE